MVIRVVVMSLHIAAAGLLLAVPMANAWVLSSGPLSREREGRGCRTSSSTARFNLLDDFLGYHHGDHTQMPRVESLPYGEPILPVTDERRVIAIQERGISFTGEDFDVCELRLSSDNGGQQTTTPVCRVRGALLHLPGKDQMRLTSAIDGMVHAKLDRKLLAVTPTYDIYRGNEKICWIERVQLAWTDTFEVHLESTFHFGPIKQAPAAYKLEGDFMDRTFRMKDAGGRTVAVISKDGFFPQFDAFNHYQVSIAPGMDVGLVVACACAIDEELDEEHQKQQAENNKAKAAAATAGGDGHRGWF
jgi:uncharacterized protein YxjI